MPLPSTALTLLVAASLTRDVVTGAAAAAIGLLVLAIMIVGLVARVSMPFRLPASLFAIIVGTALAYLVGAADSGKFADAFTHLGFYPLLPNLAWYEGLGLLFTSLLALITVILPITLYNAIETMNN